VVVLLFNTYEKGKGGKGENVAIHTDIHLFVVHRQKGEREGGQLKKGGKKGE